MEILELVGLGLVLVGIPVVLGSLIAQTQKDRTNRRHGNNSNEVDGGWWGWGDWSGADIAGWSGDAGCGSGCDGGGWGGCGGGD